MNAANTPIPGRFYLLDALRGIAALSVVCFHWQNLLVQGDVERMGYAGNDLPFQRVLGMVYQHGFLAVDLFFSLSGFIFFCFYAEKVAGGRVPARQFFILRFSRLYPLYFTTLLLAAVGQALFLHSQGRYMAYWHNDLFHFVLNVPLLSSVGLEQGLSFNGPAWSISVEAFLYLTFFLVCRAGNIKPWLLVLISVFGFFMLSRLYAPLGRGVGSFFLGGLVFALYRRLAVSPLRPYISAGLLWLVGLMWLTTWLVQSQIWSLEGLPALGRFAHRFPTLLLFPMTILALALAENARSRAGPALSWLGDISYSSYLWHFPLQLAFGLVVAYAGLSTEVFKTGGSMLLFLAALLLLSWASHRLLEMPAQRAMRSLWLRRDSAV